LEVFLQEAQGLNPEPQHIKEVCFLYVQCMEVSNICMKPHRRGTSSMLPHDALTLMNLNSNIIIKQDRPCFTNTKKRVEKRRTAEREAG